MPTYNIIYTSPSNHIYLWNGKSLDKLGSRDRVVLKYSGKSITEDGLQEAIKNCKQAVGDVSPTDSEPEITVVRVKVSN